MWGSIFRRLLNFHPLNSDAYNVFADKNICRTLLELFSTS